MDNSMKRKQFHLTHEDDRLLKELASDKGCSEAKSFGMRFVNMP